MKKYLLTSLLLAALATPALTSCTPTTPQGSTTEASAPKADASINRALRFYAGISKDSVNISEADARAWQAYSTSVKSFTQRMQPTRQMINEIANEQLGAKRDSIDYVLYPFSGPDFLYPITLFPEADTFFLCGLEPTGNPIDKNIKTAFSNYESYRQALANYFRVSYFASREMSSDFQEKEVDGVCPIVTMLMAINDCEVVSIAHKAIDAEGRITDADEKSPMLEIKFFRSGTNHEQTLYYFSGDLADKNFDANLQKYLTQELPQHTVGTYLKAASFLLHFDLFSTMRQCIIDNSLVLVQDDSGVPYRFLSEKFDVALYGEYLDPTEEFSEKCYQPDLEKIYKEKAAEIKPLNCRIGYNNPSNWQVARRK